MIEWFEPLDLFPHGAATGAELEIFYFGVAKVERFQQGSRVFWQEALILNLMHLDDLTMHLNNTNYIKQRLTKYCLSAISFPKTNLRFFQLKQYRMYQ